MDILFFLKKVISTAIMPINVVILSLIFSLICFNKFPKLSRRILLSATAILTLGSVPAISDQLILPHEDNYQAFTRSSVPVDYIIILGCSHTTDAAWPATSQLKACSLQRMVEALRIAKIHPEAQIITSGFAGGDSQSNASVVRDALVSLGVPSSKISMENFPKDTEEEAQLIAPRIKGRTSVLITNANHLPRAMNYFEQQGVFPIAAPTAPYAKGLSEDKNWDYYLPNGGTFRVTTTAWYESLGKTVQWLKSWF